MKDCAVVLAGAVGQGAYDAGALRGLARRGIAPRRIVATSSGALSSLMLARGLLTGRLDAAMASLADIWVEEASIWKLLRTSTSVRGIVRRRGIFDQTHLLALMHRYLQPIPRPHTALRLSIVVAPLAGEEVLVNGAPHRRFEKVVTFTEVDFTSAERLARVFRTVAASTAFPLLFVPVELPGVGPTIDGGAVNNTALSLARGADPIFLISARPADNWPTADVGGIALASRLAEILVHERVVRDLERMADRARIIEIRPTASLPGSVFSALFGRARRRAYVEIGYQRALAVLEHLDRPVAGLVRLADRP